METFDTNDVSVGEDSGRAESASSDSSVFADAFVLSDVFDLPTPLHRGRVTSIGRDPENDVVLASGVVSRRHALIRWDGHGFVLFDMGSTNGTSLNGRHVSIARLAQDDLIGVGPFEFRFVTSLPLPADRADDETSVFALPGAFAGEIGPVSLSEVWQLLELNQKSGLLEVRDEGDEGGGSVWFSAGVAVHAQCGEILGNPAALRLLALGRGHFRFTGRPIVRLPRTIQGGTGSLLFEAARLADEKRFALKGA